MRVIGLNRQPSPSVRAEKAALGQQLALLRSDPWDITLVVGAYFGCS